MSAASKAAWADPGRNRLAALSPTQRADYDLFRRKGLAPDEAFRLASIAKATA
jgi:hypothetical protein